MSERSDRTLVAVIIIYIFLVAAISILLSVGCSNPLRTSELIYNGSFQFKLDGWRVWEHPQFLVDRREFQWERTDDTQGTIYQETGQSAPAGATFLTTFQARGGSRLVVLIVDSDFSCKSFSEFNLHEGLQRYTLRSTANCPMKNVSLYFYAGTVGEIYAVTDISMRRER